MSSRGNSKTTIAPLNSSATTRRGGNWSDARSPHRSSLKSHASFGQSQSWSLEPLLRILKPQSPHVGYPRQTLASREANHCEEMNNGWQENFDFMRSTNPS